MRPRGLGRVFQASYKDSKSGGRKRTATWSIEYSYRGRRYYESTGSRRRNDAVQLLRQRLAEIGQGRLIGPDASKTTFDDLAQMLVDDYVINGRKTLKDARGAVKRLRECFGRDHAMDITADRVAAFIRARQEAGAQPATINNHLAALKRMFTLAIRAGKIGQRPYIPCLAVHNVRTGFFEAP